MIYENFWMLRLKKQKQNNTNLFKQTLMEHVWRSVIVAHGWSRITDDAQITKSIRDNKKWNIITHFKKTLYDL